MKLKNSKYLIAIALMLMVNGLSAQLDTEGFSPAKRDTEVTRITFENFLKKWDGDILLNRIKKTKGTYQKGNGMTIRVEAENAQIYMSVHGGSFQNADGEIMDTFFTDAMVGLQKARLEEAAKRFMVDYKNYLPKLSDSEYISFVFEVKDQARRKNGKELPPSKLAHKRTYQLEARVTYSDFQAFRAGQLNEEALLKKIIIESKNS